MEVGTAGKGTCQIFYKSANQLDKIVYTNDKRSIDFFLSDVWLNNQPAKCLKDFDFTVVNPNTIIECNTNNEDLYILFNPQEEISLTITYESIPYTFSICPELTGFGLRMMIQKKLDLDAFEILDNDKCQLDESLILKTYNNSDFTLVAKEEVVRKEKLGEEEGGFGMAMNLFVNFREPIDLQISNTAPAWRTIDKGFNLEGKCINQACQSFKENSYVCIEKKFGEFHISEVTCNCKCPQCKEPLKNTNIDNCIFLDCIYSIEGMDENDEKTSIFEKVALKDKPVSFARDILNKENGNIIKWKYLKIKVEEPKGRCTLF